MARKKASELTAGIFVLLTLAAGLAVAVWLGSSQLFHKPAQQVAFSVAIDRGPVGIGVGDSVVVNDYEIGKIMVVKPGPPGQMLYLADITDPKWVLRVDARAHSEAAALGSGQLVVTNPGSADKPAATPDQPIALLRGGIMGSLATMSEKLEAELDSRNKQGLLGKIHVVIESLQQVAADATKISAALAMETDAKQAQSVLAKVHQGIDELKTVAAHLATETDAAKAATLFAKVHQVADGVTKAVNDVAAIVADARPKLDRSLTAVADTAEQIRDYTRKDIAQILLQLRETSTKVLKIASDFTDVSGSVREVVMLNKDNLDEMIDNLTQVSVNLKSASSEIRRKPWRLLYVPDEKELHSQNIYDAAAAFSGGASQLDQAITKLTALKKAHPQGVPADDPTLARIRKELEECFTRFTKAEQALFKELSK